MRESLQDGVLYPDDLPGYGPLPVAEPAPVEADDVPHDDASYGKWLKVGDGEDPKYVTAPEALRAFLADAYDRHGLHPTFEVLAMDRGPEDHDPYRVEAVVRHDTDGEKVDEDPRVYKGKNRLQHEE